MYCPNCFAKDSIPDKEAIEKGLHLEKANYFCLFCERDRLPGDHRMRLLSSFKGACPVCGGDKDNPTHPDSSAPYTNRRISALCEKLGTCEWCGGQIYFQHLWFFKMHY